jgi:hypothetical protein
VYWERVRIYPMNICQPKRFQQTLTPTGMQRSFELIIKLSLFGYFNRIFYLFSFGIVLFELGTGLRAYDSHREHPISTRPNREQRTKGFTRCESWPSLCGSISTVNASGLVVCFLKSQRAAQNDQGIHFVCFWYCIFTWFSIFTLVF